MITWGVFKAAVQAVRGLDLDRNLRQRSAIEAPPGQSLFIVAGPGSGKTTVLVLRVLKLVFVDGMPPEGILATTFTRRAAAQLRSRILGWGDRLRNEFIDVSRAQPSTQEQLRSVDLNRIVTGTLDSIAEQVLTEHRAPGGQPPVVIEEFIANGLMLQRGLFTEGRFNSHRLRDYVSQITGTRRGLNAARVANVVREIYERIHHDRVDTDAFRTETRPGGEAPHGGVEVALDAIADYEHALQEGLLLDYVQLETTFLRRLLDGSLDDFLGRLKCVCVDEYQDTNLLQEGIYFTIARAALGRDGSVAVVGDDDQSLFRFRGATVDLFEYFSNRFNEAFNRDAQAIHLAANYRSTDPIVGFCRQFISLDPTYGTQRVAGKPAIVHAREDGSDECQVIGLFRDDPDALAGDLAAFIFDVVRGAGVEIPTRGGGRTTVQIADAGSSADCVLLCSSPKEFSSGGQPRLPLRLRRALGALDPAIQVFNPRGQDLNSMPSVQLLCGLMMECLDPDHEIQDSIRNLPPDATDNLDSWRSVAQRTIRSDRSLAEFVLAWQTRTALRRPDWDEREVHLNDLAYKLVTWIPQMQDDIEGLVYLEAVTRTINDSGASGLNRFRSRLIHDPQDPGTEAASIREAIWSIMVPLAAGVIDINEDLLETLPMDRLGMLSIHQAKGLEFPLVIADVGSDFRSRHWAQAFKRYPRDGGQTGRLEEELRPFSPLGLGQRSVHDRAFDDLIRLYFVAYSRAQDVLVLTGLTSALGSIENVATGWDRTGTSHWPRLGNLVHI